MARISTSGGDAIQDAVAAPHGSSGRGPTLAGGGGAGLAVQRSVASLFNRHRPGRTRAIGGALFIGRTLILVGCALTAVTVRSGAQCLGDFDLNGEVTIDEIITSVDNALEGCPPSEPRFVDNGNGTITDRRTKLVWEKKTGTVGVQPASPDVHDVNNTYTWGSDATKRDGTAFSEFLAKLNDEVWDGGGDPPTGCFVDHCDWRIPTVFELQGILTASYPDCSKAPCIDPIFGPTGTDQHGFLAYWSTTVDTAGTPWRVSFYDGFVPDDQSPTTASWVRAVRGP